jgi:hypothetical protein
MYVYPYRFERYPFNKHQVKKKKFIESNVSLFVFRQEKETQLDRVLSHAHLENGKIQHFILTRALIGR